MRAPNNVLNNGANMRNNMFRGPILPPRPSYDPPRSLPGFYISSEDEVTAGDVPMDGSISFFPAKDLSRILIRQWDASGNLESCIYVPQIPNEHPAQTTDVEQSNPSQEQNALVTALNSLNQGLSTTFNQFGMALQSMQQKLDLMNQNYVNCMQHPNGMDDADARG